MVELALLFAGLAACCTLSPMQTKRPLWLPLWLLLLVLTTAAVILAHPCQGEPEPPEESVVG